MISKRNIKEEIIQIFPLQRNKNAKKWKIKNKLLIITKKKNYFFVFLLLPFVLFTKFMSFKYKRTEIKKKHYIYKRKNKEMNVMKEIRKFR